MVPNFRSTTQKQMMSRSAHFARDAITSLQIVIVNWFVDATGTGNETGLGGSTTVEASVEYPANTFTRIQFSGIDAGSVASGATLVSDACSVTIPDGAQFWVRMYKTSATGIVYMGFPNSRTIKDETLGDAATFGVSGVTNQVMSGTVTSNANSANVRDGPVVIIGTTSKRTFFLLGDSICQGYEDTPDGVTGRMGILARSIGENYGYINAGISSDRATYWAGSHTGRGPLMDYCTDVIVQLGFNDIFSASRTASQVKTDLGTIYTYAVTTKGKRCYQTTITPKTTSTDSWATTANQTVTGQESVKAGTGSVNEWIRANTAAIDGYFETADVLESARDSGKWKVDGTANKYTPDGIHPDVDGYVLVQSSEVVAFVPDAPTIGTATAGDASASVAFTAPAIDGGGTITGYTATSTPGSFTGTGASSPITVSGLTNGQAYTFTVHATNAVGNSAESAASNSVTPAAAAAPSGVGTLSKGRLTIGYQLQAKSAAGGMSGSYRAGGFALSPIGEVYVQDLQSAVVPQGATRAGGMAFGADGRLYVTTDAPTAPNRGKGLATRADGALYVTTSAVASGDSIGDGIARSPNGALRVAIN